MDSPSNDPAQITNRPRYSSLRTAACWIAGSIMIVGGLGQFTLGGGWPNEQVSGLVAVVGGFCLIPPLLRRIRERWTWARPVWVPVLWFIALAVIAPRLLTPLAPSSAEQARLRAEAIAAADRLLAEGDFAGARTKLSRFAMRPDPDGNIRATRNRIDEAESAAEAETRAASLEPGPDQPEAETPDRAEEQGYPDPAAVYVERVQTYWLPQVEALPDTAPTGGEAYGALLTQLEALRSYVADGKQLRLTPAQQAIHSEFSSALSAKQRKLFPSFRRSYTNLLGAQLFRRDILVSVAGPRADILRFTGPIFVRNANIEDMQAELASALAQTRFRRVEYRWSRYAPDSIYYDLDPPADADVTP